MKIKGGDDTLTIPDFKNSKNWQKPALNSLVWLFILCQWPGFVLMYQNILTNAFCNLAVVQYRWASCLHLQEVVLVHSILSKMLLIFGKYLTPDGFVRVTNFMLLARKHSWNEKSTCRWKPSYNNQACTYTPLPNVQILDKDVAEGNAVENTTQELPESQM